MEYIDVTLTGEAPLLMHSDAGLSPMHPISRKQAEMNSRPVKEKKTTEFVKEMSRLDWELALYFDEKAGPVLPPQMLEAMIRDSAKAEKLGSEVKRSVRVTDFTIPLQYSGPRDKKAMWASERFYDSRGVKIGQSRVLRTRPMFESWSVTFNVEFEPEFMPAETLKRVIEVGGRRVGLGDYRPRFGRFSASFA